jgi:hypothetical protein
LVDFFFKHQLINERLARNMLQWEHSGFSLDGSVRIPAGCSRTREALSQYIARAPVSLGKPLPAPAVAGCANPTWCASPLRAGGRITTCRLHSLSALWMQAASKPL